MTRPDRQSMIALFAACVLLSTPTAAQPGKPLNAPQLTKTPVPSDSSAPAPRVMFVGGSPTTTSITWLSAATGMALIHHEVQRWHQSAPDCCRSSAVLQAGQSLDAKWVDYDFPLSGIYVYRVTSVYKDGRRGTVQVDYTRPEPVNPAMLTAEQVGANMVRLTWPEVADASFYQLWGDGITSTGRTVSDASIGTVIGVVKDTVGGVVRFAVTLTGIPAGQRSWRVASYYEPPACGPIPAVLSCNRVSTAASAFTQGSVNMAFRWVPPPQR